MQPMTIALISRHRLWTDSCYSALEQLPQIAAIHSIVTDGDIATTLPRILEVNPDVAVISAELPAGTLHFIRSLRDAGYRSPILMTCSCSTIPPFLDDLDDLDIAGLLFSDAGIDEFTAALEAVANGQPNLLTQHYLRITRELTCQPYQEPLTERECAILSLVAQDLKDQEIADRLQISVKTVNSDLHISYSKLGVRGRAGAVVVALRRGLIPWPHSRSGKR